MFKSSIEECRTWREGLITRWGFVPSGVSPCKFANFRPKITSHRWDGYGSKIKLLDGYLLFRKCLRKISRIGTVQYVEIEESNSRYALR